MTLTRWKKIIIYPKSPFHFDDTFHKPSHFPNKLKLEDWEPGKYWQSIRIGKQLYGVKIEEKDSSLKPQLSITLFSQNNLATTELAIIKKELVWRFELDRDLTEFNRIAKKDRRFYPVFKKWLGARNTSEFNLYELLIIGLVLQNATVRRSTQMLDTLLGKFGTKLEFDKKTIWAIWLPENLHDVSEQTLRDLKIGYRAKYLKRLSDDFGMGKINEHHLRTLSKEAAGKELTKLYGVGPETARILLFEALHHWDTFDHIAPWQQKIYSRLFYNKPLVPTNQIQNDIKKRYGKYSMLAVHYIWEDIFWRRKTEHIGWLEKEIRL